MNGVRLIQISVALVIAGAVTAGSQLLLPAAPAACDPTRDIFIASTVSPSDGGDDRHMVVSKFDPDAPDRDLKLVVLQDYTHFGGYDREGRIFLEDKARRSLHEYSICSGRLRRLLDLPEASRWVTSARRTADGTVLVTTSERKNGIWNARLEAYRGGARISSADISQKMPDYGGIVIVGAAPDGSVAYVTEGGGDGGQTWASHYRWDRKTNAVQKIGDFSSDMEEKSGYELGALNPSATLAVRVRSGAYDPEDLEPRQYPACIKDAVFRTGKYDSVGDELVIRDQTKGTERVLYRNLSRVTVPCIGDREGLSQPIWLDDRTVVVSMRFDIYAIDTQSGDFRLISKAQPNRDPREPLQILGANDEYLLTGRASIIHMRTGKEVTSAAPRNSKGIPFILPAWSAAPEWRFDLDMTFE